MTMEHSGDADTWSWSCIENTMFELNESVCLTPDRSSFSRVKRVSMLDPTLSLYDDPTYVNLNQSQQPITYHYGDRFKGLFLFLRETNARQTTISSLQERIEKLLNIHTNCDLATTDVARFFADIILFAAVVDDRLRRIRRNSEEQFNTISRKLTKIEMKGRTRIYSLPSLKAFRGFVQRIFTWKKTKNWCERVS